MNKQTFVQGYLSEMTSVLSQVDTGEIVRFLDVLEAAHRDRRRVFIVGNGGSAATAAHMANDFMLGAAKYGGHGIRAHALSDNVPTLTAAANDISYAEVFARQLSVLAEPEDVLVTISASGNSPNILRVIETARGIGLRTVGFLGMGGGEAAPLLDVAIVVPSNGYGAVESVHLVLDHLATEFFQRLQRQ
jgi:D-sedoheptulose 7-phosphate isomerase